MRPLRTTHPDGVYEVTSRTLCGQMRLRPGPTVNKLIVGCAVRAKKVFPVKIYGMVVMSNHYHMLIGAEDAERLAAFMGHLNGNLTRVLNRHNGLSGLMWGRRYKSIPVSLRVGAARMRMRYILSHGVKERLVAKVSQWPGVSTARWMLDGEEIQGYWVNRTAMYRARQAGKKVTEAMFREKCTLKVDPLPELADMPVQARRAVWREMVAKIEKEHAEATDKDGKKLGPPAGVAAVLAMDPTYVPTSVKLSRAPTVHAAEAKDRHKWKARLRALRKAHRAASKAFRAGDWDAEFPAGMFRPHGPFVPWPGAGDAAGGDAPAAEAA